MASLDLRYDDNVPGPFYCDETCIDCDLCRETSPTNFRRNDEGDYSYVFKQPTTEAERALCQEALENCPVNAIGSNGPPPPGPPPRLIKEGTDKPIAS